MMSSPYSTLAAAVADHPGREMASVRLQLQQALRRAEDAESRALRLQASMLDPLPANPQPSTLLAAMCGVGLGYVLALTSLGFIL
jgi:hypothetical protein